METPAILVPIMMMSVCDGRCSVERYSSRRCGSLRQYEAVELGTGRILFGISVLPPILAVLKCVAQM